MLTNANQRFCTLSLVKDFALQKLSPKVWRSVPALKAALAQQLHAKGKAVAQMKIEQWKNKNGHRSKSTSCGNNTFNIQDKVSDTLTLTCVNEQTSNTI